MHVIGGAFTWDAASRVTTMCSVTACLAWQFDKRETSFCLEGGGEEVSNGLRLRKKDGIDYRNRFSSGLIHAEFFHSFFFPPFIFLFFLFSFSYSDIFEGVLNFRSFVTHYIRRKSHSRMEIYVNLGIVM